jgi:hypothetical protein
MGNQQIIILVLCSILIGAAITTGIVLVHSSNIQSNKDALIEGLMVVSNNARAYFNKPTYMGGGNSSYENYFIPSRLKSCEDGTINLDGIPISTTVKFQAISADDSTNWIKAKLDISTQKLAITGYGGEFDDSE